MRIGYLGPPGTFSEQALTESQTEGEAVPLPTIHDTVMALHGGEVDRALVPIENSVEGSVNATLDTLANEAEGVVIVGELVLPVHYCLAARAGVGIGDVEVLASHPQATAQCAHYIRERLPRATVVAANSTAEAARSVLGAQRPTAALSTRRAAEAAGLSILDEHVEDTVNNETRFVWLAPEGTAPHPGEPHKTTVVFWGAGDDSPGWLVRCLSEFAFRGVNLTLIESRPRRLSLGHYMFFADLEGRATDAPVGEAVGALGKHAETVRVLGSYPRA